ncbi:MAG: Ig-like domain-containing protein, partial [Gemmatimonadota bacterium]
MAVAHLLLIAALQQAEPDRVVISPPTVEIQVDSTVRFRAEVLDAEGVRIDEPTLRWVVPNGEVATVDEATGVVTGVRPGTAIVFVVSGGKVGRASITVPQLPPERLDVTTGGLELRAGESIPVTLVGVTRLGEEVPVAISGVTSDNPGTAWADHLGRIYGVREGRARIVFHTATVSEAIELRVERNPTDGYELLGVPAGP